jgi:protein-tyrosine-phosphatase
VASRLLAERGLAEHVEVRSGGIAPFARDGSLVSLDARFVLSEIGIELPPDAGATDLKRQRHLLAAADLILVMTDEQRRMLGGFPEAAGKAVLTVRELAGESGDIADPSMQDEDVFRRCRDEILRCLERGLERLFAG